MKHLLVLIGVALCCSSNAQVWKKERDSTSRNQLRREDFIKDHPDHFFIWPVLKQRTQNYELQTTEQGKRTIGYYSNKPYSLGLGLYLFEVAAEITLAIPLNEKRRALYGESDARNIQANAMAKRWSADAYWQRYQGFYLKDSRVPVPANTPYVQRRDIQTENIGLSINYIFNHKRFSFRSAYNFSERQLKSAGSFLIYGSVDNFRIAGDSALLGENYAADFAMASTIQDINSFMVAAAPGYTHSLIYEGFFINGTIGIGPSLNWLSYELEDQGDDGSMEVNTMLTVKVAIGYNGERFFGGMTFSAQNVNTRFDNVNLTSSIGSFKILAGYRLLERGILKKRARDLDKRFRR